MILRKLFGLAGFALLLVAAMPAFAGQDPATPTPVPALAAAPAPEPPSCQPSLDLGAALEAKGETCSTAAQPQMQIGTPDFIVTGGRTCKCSCGFPCKTDADCGGAVGSCRAGITCC